MLLLSVALAGSPALYNGFLSDDFYLLLQREEVLKRTDGWTDLVTKPYWWGTSLTETREYIYRPWVSLTYWIEYQIAGTDPVVYHLSNVLLQVAIAGLVFRLFLALLGWELALLTTALCALCPAALTSVGWVSGRTDLWALFFSLIFLLLFRAARRTNRPLPLVGACVAWFLALCSKEIALLAPILAWLLDRMAVRPSLRNEKSAAWRSYRILLIPLFVQFALRSAVVGSLGTGSFNSENMVSKIPLWAEQYWLTAIHVLFPVRYQFFTELSWVTSAERGIGFILTWALFIGAAVLIVIGLRRRQLWAVGGAWFGLTLVPPYVLGQSWAEQADFYAYFGLPGFWLLTVDGLGKIASKLWPRFQPLGVVRRGIFAAVALLFGLLTFVRLPILSSEVSLWSHMVKREPKSVQAKLWLASSFVSRGDSLRAVSWLEQAVVIDPTDPRARVQLAGWHLDHGDVSSAAPHAEALARYAPHHAEAQLAVARYEYQVGRCAESVEQYRQAFSQRSPTTDELFRFGAALVCAENYSEAARVLEQGLQRAPNRAEGYLKLGLCYENLLRTEDAERAYRQALTRDSSLIEAKAGLVRVPAAGSRKRPDG